jgi:negative regulator of sigma E activity
MSEQKSETRLSETLSAFLDGETSPEEMHALLQALERDPRLQDALDRHHRMRAGLRGELHPGLDAGFAGRVLAGIEAGGAALAESAVIALPARHAVRPWFRGAVGLAMAASLAAVIVLAAQVLLPPPPEAILSASTLNRDSRAAAAPAPEIGIPAQARRRSEPWNDLSPAAAAELNNYLISHNNSAMEHGLGRSMGFTRVAASDGLAFEGEER